MSEAKPGPEFPGCSGGPRRGEAKIEPDFPGDFSSFAPTDRLPKIPEFEKPVVLGTIIGAYKSSTARLINGLRRTPGGPVWQRNYYDRIIRSEKELGIIERYICENPMHWLADSEHSI